MDASVIWKLAGVLVASVLVMAVAWILVTMRKQQGPATDLSDADIVLEEVEVFLAFGEYKKAIELLERAQAVNGSDVKIAAKLSQLNSQSS